MKLLDRLSSFFGMDEEDERDYNDYEDEAQEDAAPHPSITNRVTSQQQPVNQAPSFKRLFDKPICSKFILSAASKLSATKL